MEDTRTPRDQELSPGCSSVHQKRSEPEPSCVFMKSDESIDHPQHFSSVHQKKSEPEPSCVSMKSNESLHHPVNFKSEDTRFNLNSVHQKRSEPEPSCVFMKSDESIDHPHNLSSVHQKKSEPEPSCLSMKSDASLHHPVNFKSEDTRSILPPRSETKPICEKYDQSMNQPQDSTYPGVSHEVLIMFRSNLMKKFERLYEGTATQGNPTLLNEIYTELYITESESGEISNEHEVRQIETQSRRAATEDTAIKCNDVLKDWFQLNSSKHVSLSELHQRAVDEALQSKNGHLDLFLRFLLGLSKNRIILKI
ncbi:uncharacterized protein LOC107734407 [Sinocyclocheilus rhinocerous]|uniref:uncharacterized protein LOC107734407 n=1 Tax=Sinocyclocheilus rhinocerous TaxID=307959 RepID=UPI0007B9C4F2|nr:PREDICTED: uncharacterized protein LOC107734407 [Sinocyclocheilus rhinocerous]